MRLIVDQQLPPRLAFALRAQDVEAWHGKKLQLRHASDTSIWIEARVLGAVIVTRDSDFLTPRLTGEPRPPVIWVRLGNCSTEVLVAAFLLAFPELKARILDGEPLVELR